jgi:hypothetical protein
MNKRRRFKAKRRQRAARRRPVVPFWRTGKTSPFDHLRGIPFGELFNRCWNGEYDETPL